MEKVYFEESDKSPGIILDPEERLFQFSGNSRPENVRDVYYPVIEFLEKYFKNVLTSNNQDEKYDLNLSLNILTPALQNSFLIY